MSYYESLQETYDHASMFVMAQDVHAGEIVTADMIKEQRVQSTEDLSLVQLLTKEDLIGKRLKVSLTKGAVICADVMYEGAPVTDDERLVELRALDLPQTLRENEFVDIRIVFPNGEDYLVVGHKRVYRIIRDEEGEVLALQVRFLEQELLRYQAACVDAKTYQDTTMYAVQYTGEFQAAAQAYYPVNRDVFRLMKWDPNIVELLLVEEEQERRAILETGLERYLLIEDMEKENDNKQPMEEENPEEIRGPLTLYTGLPEET